MRGRDEDEERWEILGIGESRVGAEEEYQERHSFDFKSTPQEVQHLSVIS